MKKNKSILALVSIDAALENVANLGKKIGDSDDAVTALNVRVTFDKAHAANKVTALVLVRDGEKLPNESPAVVRRAVNEPVKALLFDSPGKVRVECVEFAPTLIDAIRLDKKQLQRPESKGLKVFEQASNDPWKSREARRRLLASATK
jgi:hypothetical protein